MSYPIVLNFHRVTPLSGDAANPFRVMSTISPNQFRFLLQLLRLQSTFSFYPIESEPYSFSNTRLFSFHLTFDDVPSSFIRYVLPVLEHFQVPATIFVSAVNAERGFSWRDKIYYIIQYEALRKLFSKRMDKVFNRNIHPDKKEILKSSKDSVFDRTKMERDVIDPVFLPREQHFRRLIERFHPYLNWEDISQLVKHPLIRIGNHGYSHENYARLTCEEINWDIDRSHNLIQERLGFNCRHFAVPFGQIERNIHHSVDESLAKLGYRTVGWIRDSSNVDPKGGRLLHYIRVDSSSFALINMLKCWKIALRREQLVWRSKENHDEN